VHPLPTIARSCRRLCEQRQIVGRQRRFDRLGDVVASDADLLQTFAVDPEIAAVVHDDAHGQGSPPEQAHALALGKRAGGQFGLRVLTDGSKADLAVIQNSSVTNRADHRAASGK